MAVGLPLAQVAGPHALDFIRIPAFILTRQIHALTIQVSRVVLKIAIGGGRDTCDTVVFDAVLWTVRLG